VRLSKQVEFVSSMGFGEQHQATLLKVTFAFSRPHHKLCPIACRIREPALPQHGVDDDGNLSDDGTAVAAFAFSNSIGAELGGGLWQT
jgi:hypothetical protein